eukprot:12237293-Ditylum_brightwellii.AAC.1
MQAGLGPELWNHVPAPVKGDKGQSVFVRGDFSGELGLLQGLCDEVQSKQNGFFLQNSDGRHFLFVKPGTVGSSIEFLGQDLFDGLPGSLVADARIRVAVVEPDSFQQLKNVPVHIDHGRVGEFDGLGRLPVADIIFLGVIKPGIGHWPQLVHCINYY